MNALDYEAFLRAKVRLAEAHAGATPAEIDMSPALKPHQRACAEWLIRGGRRALFAAFGLGKTIIQMEAVRSVIEREGGRGLIVAPLGVRQEFTEDACSLLGWGPKFIRSVDEAGSTGVYITNYETVRDGKIDPSAFTAASLDEASVLRGFGGTKTFREFMRLFDTVPFRFVATATPSPNDYIELLAYAAFLGIMDVGEAKTRFFKRNSEKADALTLHPHKEREFWLWVSSWALFVQRPSDLGFSDQGYDLPDLVVHEHVVRSELSDAQADRSGQMMLIRDAAVGITAAAKEKRETLAARIDAMKSILADDPESHYLLWHDLEAERHAITHALPSAVAIWGSQPLEQREQSIIDFSRGRFKYLAAKPVIAGSGCNFQRHCHKAIFLGIGFKFNDFFQAIHRIQRFLQTKTVEIHLIYSENEREVFRTLMRKWRQHNDMVKQMSAIIQEFGLSAAAMASALHRSLGTDRIEVSGEGYMLVNDDCVRETSRMARDSVDLIVTSIPFSTQYEYSPKYEDFGHTDDDAHFWAQMDYLIPNLLGVLRPGRLAAIHVKDRIVPGGVNGLGFQTLAPFHADCIAAFRRHGFAFMGMKTITTDVVRENNQTYRLGWSEQCKDATKMSFGVPEYLLLFRKPQTDGSRSYADAPVTKHKKWYVDPVGGDAGPQAGRWLHPDGYSRARWQLDAHGYTRSSGNRHLLPEELIRLEAKQVFRAWKRFNLGDWYDFEHHVRIAERFEEVGQLPSTFMLLPPHSPHPDVWTDVTRMLSANTLQAARGAELHLCPLQFDIVDRAINQWSNPGETIFDPFGGLMTVPMRAVKFGRVGWGVELNPRYFLDGCKYVEAEVRRRETPDFFALIDADQADQGEADDAEAA